MKVRRDAAAAGGDDVDDVGRAIHRLERADSERHVDRRQGQRPHERQERTRRLQIAPVRTELDAGDRDFLEARRRDPLDFAKNLLNGHTSAGASRRRDNAVTAVLVAAGLHPQREGRPARNARRDGRAACPVSVAKPLCSRLEEPILFVVADDTNDVGKRGDFFRPARRVATGDHDSR